MPSLLPIRIESGHSPRPVDDMSIDWPVVKEAAGFVGAVFTAVPWLRDFFARIGLARIKKVEAKDTLGDIAADLAAMDERWLAKAKGFDLAMILLGLGLIAFSFAIGMCLAD